MKTNKISKEYISEVKALFPIKKKEEKEYIRKLASDVDAYCEDANVTSKQEVYENYGKPHEVVSNYFSSVDTDYIVKNLKISKIIRSAIIIFLILTTIAASVFCFILYLDYQVILRQEVVISDSSIVVEEIIVEEEIIE